MSWIKEEILKIIFPTLHSNNFKCKKIENLHNNALCTYKIDSAIVTILISTYFLFTYLSFQDHLKLKMTFYL